MPQEIIKSSDEETAINTDLQEERRLASLSSEDFAEWWAGGKQELMKRRALEKQFFEDPEFVDKEHIAYMSHKELYEHTTRKTTKIIKKLKKLFDDDDERQSKTKQKKKRSMLEKVHDFREILSGPLGKALLQQNCPLGLHFSMFTATLAGQCSDEQASTWLEKAWNMDGWIGTYAQTELGHGTFLRGLETRADYDVEREEFIMNTPTLTAYKWWPGGMGQTANVAIVMAQLYIRRQHYGLHPFLVRIRNEETHEPEPGVDVGEIGPKMGMNGVNNGFLGLKNVRIPRTNMLMKNNQVLADGTFVKGPEPLLTYGTMVFMRVTIVSDVSFNLLQAATIATRYSLVRHQSPIELGRAEPKIIEHLTQQAKVFPQIAKGVFYRLAADYMWKLYQQVMYELDNGKRRNLAELHALSCCMKAICSHEAALGIETLRKSCGGHGYMAVANFFEIYGAATVACTYEGDNTVLLKQTARFLAKNYIDSQKWKVLPSSLKRKLLPSSVTYLRKPARVKFSADLKTLVRLLETTAAHKIRIVFDEERSWSRKESCSAEIANNFVSLKSVQAATLHGRAVLARIACEEVDDRLRKKELKPEVHRVLRQLLEIFVIDIFFESLGHILLANDSITGKQIAKIEARYERVLREFRPNAIAVIDGFDFHDMFLGSTLGCYDGRVYERMMAEAKKSPLNQESVNITFHTHLKPLMKGKL